MIFFSLSSEIKDKIIAINFKSSWDERWDDARIHLDKDKDNNN